MVRLGVAMPSSRALSSSLSRKEKEALLLGKLLKKAEGKKELSKLEKVLEERRSKSVRKEKERRKEKRRKLEKVDKRKPRKPEGASRKKSVKEEWKPRRRVSDVWTAKDFAVEAVKRNLRPDRKWVQLRTLGRWWNTFTRLDLEEMVKALEVLRDEHVLNCKREGRQWKLGVRAREVTLMEDAYKKRAESLRTRAKKARVKKEAERGAEGGEGGQAGGQGGVPVSVSGVVAGEVRA